MIARAALVLLTIAFNGCDADPPPSGRLGGRSTPPEAPIPATPQITGSEWFEVLVDVAAGEARSVIGNIQANKCVAERWATTMHARLRCSPKRSESGAYFCRKKRRLLPSREMPAAVNFVEVEEAVIGAPRPRFRRPVDVIGEDRNRDRQRNLRRHLRRCADCRLAAVLPIDA